MHYINYNDYALNGNPVEFVQAQSTNAYPVHNVLQQEDALCPDSGRLNWIHLSHALTCVVMLVCKTEI
jgi:hypothetical protein